MSSTDTQAKTLLQRVILPRPGEPLDVRSLYLEEAETNSRRSHAPTRTSLNIAGESEVSFATYFNAFPASYWRRWTVLKDVVLRIELKGTARVDLYRSKVDGARIALGGNLVETDATGYGVAEFATDLGPFEDGGWIWFDVTADSDTEIISAGWYATVSEEGLPDKRVTVGIPTFNRPDDAVAAIRALMPDQGNKKVIDHPDYADAIAPLGDRYQRFEQGNLGGSGGYGRIMYEALRLTDSPYVLYMDDDIAIEPDSILRALQFARFAKTPMLVGGQMLNLQDRSHLHCMGEVIDRGAFMWTAAPFVEYDHDFSKYPLSDKENSKNLHRRIDVDGNGWWMCLIPRVAAEEIGLPMPLFIKWDDWDYGLRAAEHGYPTATVPGIAIWHMAWSDKDDAIDWQAYFHLRNRLVVAALHHEGSTRGIMSSSIKALMKHLLCLEYSTVAIQIEAMRDFLRGPEALYELLPTALPKVAAMRKEYPDAVVLPSATELPRTTGAATALGTKIPLNPITKVKTLAAAVRNNLRPADPHNHEVPQANYPPLEARWFSLGRVDGVTVTTADGRGVVYRQRDREKMFALMRESLTVHREVDRRFEEMKQRYRAAYGDLTSREAWSKIFEPTTPGAERAGRIEPENAGEQK